MAYYHEPIVMFGTDLEVITNYVALTLVLATLAFSMIRFSQHFKIIPVLAMMALASVTYGRVPHEINDIMYDLVYLVVVWHIAFRRHEEC